MINHGSIADIKAKTAEELEAQFKAWGQPAYRVAQLLSWLYTRRVTDWNAMSNLPATLRARLAQTYALGALELVRVQGSGDTTRKFLWRLRDGSFIESVLIPANPALYGEPSDRQTLCVSTQVGCAYGCRFCASGLGGLKRNLSPDEIVDQVLAVERWNAKRGANSKDGESSKLPRPNPESRPEPKGPSVAPTEPVRARIVSNLVIMGMGEPLANYENLLRALQILNARWGGGIGARKITISTSGLVPQIRRLAEEPAQYRLAISLHGATNAVREQLMPVNRKYPLEDLLAACDYYVEKKGRLITLEYILIAGVNDGPDQARPLATVARRLHAKLNLIPYNHVEGLPWERPDESRQEAFLAALGRYKLSVTLRREKGNDIDAACGQLRLKTERDSRAEPGPAGAVR